MSRRTHLNHRYVEFIPKDLDEGVLYISSRFRTASHLCCCGCGQKVATPLNSSKWKLADHGDTVSLAPSIGLGTLPCRSHYWIRRSSVDWCPDMTAAQTARAQRADEYASRVYTGEIQPVTPRPAAPVGSRSGPQTLSVWGRFVKWLRSLW